MRRQTILAIVLATYGTTIFQMHACEASFLDDFETPGSMNTYTREDAYGGGGFFYISEGTLRIITADDNTVSVMTSKPLLFAAGDTLGLEVPEVSGAEAVCMMCSTIAGQPDGTDSFGFCFRRGGGKVQMQLYPGGMQEAFTDPSPEQSAILMVARESDDRFKPYIQVPGQVQALEPFTLADLADMQELHIGAQAYDETSNVFIFDNLQVQDRTHDSVDITVLTYNTYLWEGTNAAFLADLAEVFTNSPGPCFNDAVRKHQIAAKLRDCEADIVALQEVWAYSNRQYFVEELKDVYPYAEIIDSACSSNIGGLDTLGNGLVLLSKWPLSNVQFERFPTFEYSQWPGNYDCWANKGILAATVTVGNGPAAKTFRIGITHAPLEDDDRKGKMSRNYVDITPFELNGQPYIFGLHVDVGANIWRINDYGTTYSEEKGLDYGAGKELVYYGGDMSPNYKFVRSFQLNGHPYILGLHNDVGANIWRINDDPATGFTLVKYGASMSSNHVAVEIFYLNGHPYIFGLHRDVGANIWQIHGDGKGFEISSYGMDMSPNYVTILPFELNGHPYIFGLHDGAGPMIWRINDEPWTGYGKTQVCYNCPGGPTSFKYDIMTSFQLDGHPYIFGLHDDNDYASIWRINDDPRTGMTLVVDRDRWSSNYRFIKSFQLNGHPYLFSLKNCCNQHLDMCFRPRPGEAYITRIADEPVDGAGWWDALQMGNMKIIADNTIKGDLPAIIMGDLNVHLGRYGVMNTIFNQAGAIDAYVEANATTEGGETVDLLDNKLHQATSSKDPLDPAYYPKESSFDRIDYVYVKETGAGYRLVPCEAHVIRDWTYYYDGLAAPDVPDMDLSDHYPVLVKFELRSPPDLSSK